MSKNLTIAIDFDGTLVYDGCYPNFGSIKPNAINVIKKIIDNGHRIIIWTCRGGEEQMNGIRKKLNKHGVFKFIINEHFKDTLDEFEHFSPKVFASIYIDDRSLHAMHNGIDWFEIEDMLIEGGVI